MGKKKPFIDKKNSSTYHLLYRSQRDVGGEDGTTEDGNNGGADGGGGGVILWPSPNNNKETDQKVLMGQKNPTELEDTKLNEWKNQLDQVGLVDDYDYDKHMKPITGTGSFFDASGKRSSATTTLLDPRSKPIEEELIKEVDRQLESIALTADCMDDDIAHALFDDFEEGEYEELNDDFVFDAAKEPEAVDEGGDQEGFDFASHIHKLMEKARLEADGGPLGELATVHEQGRKDQEFFSKSKAIGDDDDDSGYFDENDWHIDGTPGVVPKLNEAEEKALCDKFAETLAEYDSDEIGEGQDDDEYGGVVGPTQLPLEGDPKVEAALDDFLLEKKDGIFMQGTRHYMEGNEKGGGSGFSALVGTKMVPVKQLDQMVDPTVTQTTTGTGNRRDIQPIESILGEADDTLGAPMTAPPAEEVFIDGKSYYSEKIRNPWDCESILTTYSNLDNNPVTIGTGGGRRRRKQPKRGESAEAISETEPVQQIQLSDKTGLPLGVLPSREYDDGGVDTYVSVNKGEARKKKETPEEKKLRKQNIKKERQLARMQKKMMKEAFNDEFSKRTHEILSDDVGGKSVFRF